MRTETIRIESNYSSRPLKKHPYANAKVLETDTGAILVSYSTVVAQISFDKAFCYGLYSMTTRKHISAFANEHGLSYGVFKKVYEGEYLCYDISANEFVK